MLARTPDAKRAVIEVSRDLDGRLTEPLEIAVGDRIRIGATQWEKQLFNGTVVTVEDLEVRPAEAAAVSDTAVSRKARNRQARGAAGRDLEPGKGDPESEISVHITARTDDGRRVTFRHDEIRDWHDNIRLDYGYAMTIASAQGLTVDRAFLLVDERPARETIYPAATRHREALDIYVNRSPLAFDIAQHRPEDQADMPVTDSDVRAYLAERWSRSQPKEAALDYITDGEWRDAREDAQHEQRGTEETRQETAGDRAAANDNAIVRIAREIRHAVNGWRHGATVDAFAAERTEVLTAWDELRERTRNEGNAVALSPAFRETLDRHGALMKQARMFRARPQVFERLLEERAGIGEREIAELGEVHARAGTYRRSVAGKAARSRQTDAERTQELAQAHAPVETPARPPEPVAESRQPGEGEPRPVRPIPAELEVTPTPEHSEEAYRQLRIDWQRHAARAERSGMSPFDLDGAAELIRRIGEFAGNENLPAEPRRRLQLIVRRYNRHLEAGAHLEAWLKDADGHWQKYDSIYRRAHALDVAPDTLRPFRDWLERNERLLRAGRAILDDPGTYGVHLDRMEGAGRRVRDAVSRMEGFSAERQSLSQSRDWGSTRSV